MLNKNNTLSSKDVNSLLNITNFSDLDAFIRYINTLPDEISKSNNINSFLTDGKFKENSSWITSENIIKMIDETQIMEEHSKFTIIQTFIKSEKSSKITSENFIKMIMAANIEDKYKKNSIIETFINSEKSSEITPENVIKIINELKIENEDDKKFIIDVFINIKKPSAITSEDVIAMIEKTEINDEILKAGIIINFICKPKSEINQDDVFKMMERTNIINDNQKAIIIFNFVKKKSSEISQDDVFQMMEKAEIISDKFKELIIGIFVSFNKSSFDSSKDVANIIKRSNLQYRPDLSIKIFDIKFSTSENYIENFIDFTKDLHPSEAMQCEFVKEFILRDKINSGNLKDLKPFIEGLQDNELALELIEILSRKGVLVNEKDTLSLVKNRSKKQYAFLTEVVGKEDLNHCITDDGIKNLKAIFGEDLKIGEEPITIGDLISYYDIRDKTSSLSKILKPEFKKQLRDNFVPSAEILLYKPAELNKLKELFSEEGVVFDVKSYLVENATLCDHLKEKVGEVKEIDSRETYQINFANFGIEEEKQTEINDLFNKLLQSDNPNQQEVKKFFADLLGIAFSDIDDDKKLTTFFQKNKKELAHCFCDEKLSKENFASLFSTLQDGCFANIGAQFKKMLYATMIKDEDAQILYAVADDKIFSGIINSHGSDIMIGNFSPISDEIIKSYSLSPMALIKKLSEEEMMTDQKTWDIIGKIAGDDKDEILERLVETYTVLPEFNQKAKEIASYLIIKNVVGEPKIKDLESKNPQLKELGDLIYGRAPKTSPRILQQQDQNAPQARCFNLSGLLNCLRRS